MNPTRKGTTLLWRVSTVKTAPRCLTSQCTGPTSLKNIIFTKIWNFFMKLPPVSRNKVTIPFIMRASYYAGYCIQWVGCGGIGGYYTDLVLLRRVLNPFGIIVWFWSCTVHSLVFGGLKGRICLLLNALWSVVFTCSVVWRCLKIGTNSDNFKVNSFTLYFLWMSYDLMFKLKCILSIVWQSNCFRLC